MLQAILLQKHLVAICGLLYGEVFVKICTRWKMITYMRHGYIFIITKCLTLFKETH